VTQQTTAVGHAVRAAYMYSAMADIAALSGDDSYVAALDSIWADVVSKKTYLTGGIGSAGGNEGFSAAYDLPNETAYGETCAAIANALWNYRMFLLKGDAQYLDIFERVAYNGFLSGLALQGNRFFYPNPLASSGQHQRQPWFNCACCPPNVTRFLASLPGYLYAVQGQRIYVNLYVRSESVVPVATGTVTIRQNTDYPWNGSVSLTVEPSAAGDFELLVRIPGWARNQPLAGGLYRFSDAEPGPPRLRVNGRPVPLVIEQGFAKLSGPWKRGDRVQLDLAMPVRRVESHEALQANRGLSALQRGPLLYCVEWPDNGGEVKNLVLDPSLTLSSRFIPGLLGGVTVVEGKALALVKGADGKRILKNRRNFRAIPYFAWANRGRGEMAVWLARSDEYARPSPGLDTVDLTRGWKFIPGDNPDYARPDLEEAGWKPFSVDRVWEEQGHKTLDGFAWYRLRVVIPSRLKERAYLKDGLRLFLGKINNFDQTFLNGKLVGVNNRLTDRPPADEEFIKSDMTLYNQERCYVLPFDDPRILWDRENVIALRVFDEGGLGGVYTGDLSLRPLGFRDHLALDLGQVPFSFKGTSLSKLLTLANTSDRHAFQGTFTLAAQGKRTQRQLWRRRFPMNLRPGNKWTITIQLEKMDQAAALDYSLQCPATGESWSFHEESPYVLTPSPAGTPRLNGSEVIGARPGKPFLHALGASGRRPLAFSIKDLPPGLNLDQETGIIQGRAPARGEYLLQASVRNELGNDERTLRLVVGDSIALTPPMGWNSWNCWGASVDSGKVAASAAMFKEKGLLDHGWGYINIDDGWEIFGEDPRPRRDSQGTILTNEKFPDMKSLGDKIHALGLKFGIYSSPGPLTCAGYTGTYEHEFQDARTFADWGVDYLKYDWCSYDTIAPQRSLKELQQPYLLMRQALDAVDRDIVFSLCQYGMGKVWEWGAQVGGNSWRTTEDIEDTWQSMSTIGFNQVENAPFAGPGHWNDPDMLVVGWVGWGPNLHPSRLTPDEQYTHLSLWCLLSAPLLIGCDLERLDPFTLNLLCNDEVLALDQDVLGRPALPRLKSGSIQVWVKELADGERAVGIFNLGEETAAYTLDLKAAGLPAEANLRDLWRQRDLGRISLRHVVTIPGHGVVLLKTTK
jgi:alpha-galactosidase